MITLKLLSVVLGFDIVPVNGKELREKSFGYEHGLRTACITPLKDNEWISLSNNTIHFGYKDMRPEVLINIPDGVYTFKKINLYELSNICKEWAFDKGYEIHSFKRANMCYRAYPVKIGRGGSDFEVSDTSEPEAVFKACEHIL